MSLRHGGAALVALVALALLVLGAAPTTLAAFTDTDTVAAGTAASPSTAFRAGSIATPVTPTLTQQASTGATLISWSTTGVTTGGTGTATADRYDVYRYSAASGGTGAPVCTGVTATSCTVANASGTQHYAVRARFKTSWFQEGARRAFTPDAAGPAIDFTRPTDGFSGSDSQLRSHVTCTNGAPACGTSADPSGVTDVQYTLVARLSGTSMVACWTGSTYDVSGGACPLRDTIGTTSWRVPGSKTEAYPNGYAGTATLTIVATDGFGNTSTESITYRSTG